MKTLFVFFLISLFCSMGVSAQTSDSLHLANKRRIEDMEKALRNLGRDLQNFNHQYRQGTTTIIIGIGTTIAGVASLYLFEGENAQGRSQLITVLGAGLTITGVIIQIDSHKYLAGRGSVFIGPKRAGIRYRF